jgi:hypothetical protein
MDGLSMTTAGSMAGLLGPPFAATRFHPQKHPSNAKNTPFFTPLIHFFQTLTLVRPRRRGVSPKIRGYEWCRTNRCSTFKISS